MKRFALFAGFGLATMTMASAQQVGVPVCDDFLAKYEACVTTRIPAAQQPAFKTSLDQTRKAWSDAAKNPTAKAALESSCKQTADQLKQTLAAYNCSF